MSNLLKNEGTYRSQKISCNTLYLAEDTYLIVLWFCEDSAAWTWEQWHWSFITHSGTMEIFWKIKPSFRSDTDLLVTKGASRGVNLGLFLLCVYLKEVENYLIFREVCDWYPLLLTLDNLVSITNTILWDKDIRCDQARHIWAPFPLIIRPWRSCEPSRQIKQIFFFSSLPTLRFLGASLIVPLVAWKVWGTQPDRCCLWSHHRTGKHNSTQNTV